MFKKVMLQTVCAVCMLGVSGAIYSEVCETTDGLLFSSNDKTVSKFNFLSSGCRQIHTQDEILPRSLHESPQLRLYDGEGVASVDLKINTPASFLTKNSSDQFYSISITRPVVDNIGFVEEIYATAEDFNIDPLLLHAIAHVESRHNPDAVSSAGARGLMQVMPATARRMGMTDPDQQLFDPIENLTVSAAYLRNLYDLFGNNLDLVLAAYNAGEQAVIRYDYKVPPYKETQQYVTLVMGKYKELMQLATSF